CLDKTGTLTEGDIAFEQLYLLPDLPRTAASGSSVDDRVAPGDAQDDHRVVDHVGEAGHDSGGAAPDSGGREGWVRSALGAFADGAHPTATAAALAPAFPPPAGPDAQSWERTGAVAFSSARKWSAASFARHGSWVLGAPEMVVDDAHSP